MAKAKARSLKQTVYFLDKIYITATKDDDDFVTVLECVKIHDTVYLFQKECFVFGNNTGVLSCYVITVRVLNPAAFRLKCEISYNATH